MISAKLSLKTYHCRSALKGLSHEIDFKNFDKKFTELDLTMGRSWFLNFYGLQ
jgi:hypothetical protein